MTVRRKLTHRTKKRVAKLPFFSFTVLLLGGVGAWVRGGSLGEGSAVSVIHIVGVVGYRGDVVELS